MGDFLLMKDFAYWISENALFSRDQILMITDTLYARFQANLHILLHSSVSTLMILNPRMLEDLYTWGDDVLKYHGNDGYNTIKILEPFFVSRLLEKDNSLPISAIFAATMHKDIDKGHGSCQCNTKLFTIIPDVTVPEWLTECHGLYRHWGHPTVDETGGMNKVLNISRTNLSTSKESQSKLKASFIRLFVLSYMSKHGKWPEMVCMID